MLIGPPRAPSLWRGAAAGVSVLVGCLIFKQPHPMETPQEGLISYCMIVKNEAETLEQNLQTARPFVDEMVIADTGSEDGTKEIAQEYADKFLEFEWPDNFSEARNRTLDEATCDFIMYLDGDEAVTNPEHWKNIRNKLRDDDPDALAIQIENELPGNQLLAGDRIWEVRLFRNHPEVRFEGRVHNQITPSIKRHADGEAYVDKVKAVSHHIGYSHSQDDMLEKYADRIPLIRAEIEDAEEVKWESYYRYQLVNGLFMLEDYEEAWDEFKQTEREALTEENTFSLLLMGVHLAIEMGLHEKASGLATEMIDLWGQEPIAYLMKGIAELNRNRDNAAFTLILSAMQVSQIRDNIRYDIDTHYAASAAGEAAFKMELYGHAKKMFQHHLEEYPNNERIRSMEQAIQPAPENPEKAMKDTPSRPTLESR